MPPHRPPRTPEPGVGGTWARGHPHADRCPRALFTLAVAGSHVIICGQIRVCARTGIRTGPVAFRWEARFKKKCSRAVIASALTNPRGSKL